MEIIDAIFPMIANWKLNKKIKENIEKKPDSNGVFEGVENPDSIKDEELIDIYEKGFEQKGALEDKAKINVVGITIAISLIMGANSVIKEIVSKTSSPILIWLSVILMVIAVLYMIFAGVMSIKIITDENIVETIKLGLSNSKEKRNNYNHCISVNASRNLIRNNYVFSSYECIRNSLVCLFLVFLISVIPLSTQTNTYEFVQGKYDFFYESETLPIINSNKNYIVGIEKTVNHYLETLTTETNTQKDIALVDNENNLFVKFHIENNIVRILTVEKFEIIE